MNKVKKYTHVKDDVFHRKRHRQNTRKECTLPDELISIVFSYFNNPQDIYYSSIVCKKWNNLADDKMSKLITGMDWSIYIISSKLAISVLGKTIPQLATGLYQYSGLGGITSYMIWQSLKGNNVTVSSFHNDECRITNCKCLKNIPPSLVIQKNGSECELISYTPKRFYPVIDLFKDCKIETRDSSEDEDLGDYDLGIYNCDSSDEISSDLYFNHEFED